jgi:hypothetical protein
MAFVGCQVYLLTTPYTARFRSDPGPALDPYAPDQTYLHLFKCLHALANQVGLGMTKEAQLYHLLAAAANQAGSQACRPVASSG